MKKKYIIYWGRGAGIFFLFFYNILLILNSILEIVPQPSNFVTGFWNILAGLTIIGFFAFGIKKN